MSSTLLVMAWRTGKPGRPLEVDQAQIAHGWDQRVAMPHQPVGATIRHEPPWISDGRAPRGMHEAHDPLAIILDAGDSRCQHRAVEGAIAALRGSRPAAAAEGYPSPGSRNIWSGSA